MRTGSSIWGWGFEMSRVLALTKHDLKFRLVASYHFYHTTLQMITPFDSQQSNVQCELFLLLFSNFLLLFITLNYFCS